ncbi:MAG TPA: SCP2 sterol-binding domain-containing protein [Candidatus Dormibacteraeota bacterium]|nr:SCP2 sterol-binding domain-containing protein [Candidatus Dormibacteraeota bacterium]
MSDELREMTVADITPEVVFAAMPSQLDPVKARGVNATVQFELSGDQGGTWWVRIADGQAESGQGKVESPNLVMMADARDYVKIAIGELNGVTAFMTGKLRVRGDLTLAMKMQTIFKIPKR